MAVIPIVGSQNMETGIPGMTQEMAGRGLTTHLEYLNILESMAGTLISHFSTLNTLPGQFSVHSDL